MNSISRRQRVSVRVGCGLLIGALAVIGSTEHACSQSSVRSSPGEWTSLVAPALPNGPGSVNSPGSASSLAFTNPLKNLRQPDPSGLLSEERPAQRVLGNTNYSSQQHRSEPALAVGWSQPGLRHRQLYFQDDQIERGNAKRTFPNVTAGVKFFKSVFEFPVRLVTGR